MNITVITPPPFEPVTLTEVYQKLRITPDHAGSPGEETHPDDDDLNGSIATAREIVEQMTRRSLIQQTLRLSMAGFPLNSSGIWGRFLPADQQFARPREIRLFKPPVIRVDLVSYYDADNVLQIVDPTSYYVTDEDVPELRFVSSFQAPTVYSRPDAVRVVYVAGYAADGSPPTTQAEFAANIPSSLKDAVLAGVQLLYDDLLPQDAEVVIKMREALVQPFRVQLSL